MIGEPTSMVRSFLLRELRSLRLELEAYPDEGEIWALPTGLPNSAGTLARHLTGSLRHYIGAVLGGTDYERDRKAEFAGRPLPRAALLAEIDATVRDIEATLPHLNEGQLAERFSVPIGGHWLTTGELLIHLAVHLGYHLGQVSYHRRIVTGDSQGVGSLPLGELSTAVPVDHP